VPGAAAAAWTLTRLIEGEWRLGLVWLAALAAATVAEALPVPIEGVGAGTTSFATVFIAATAAELGPEASASLAALAILIAHARRQMPLIRRLYNVFLYCLAGAAAGFAALAIPDQAWSAGGVAVAAAAFYIVDVGMLTLVFAANSGEPWLQTAKMMFKTTVLPFVAMASLSVTLYALWQQGWIVLSLAPPLILLVILQRHDAAARAKQRELDRAKDEFLATTSHELRTPLASVYGAAQTLHVRSNLDEERRRELMSVIAAQSTRLTELVEDVLWAARLGAGQVDQRLRPCPVAETIDEVFAAEAAAGNGDRIRRGRVTAASCRADADHLHRILFNLVDNGIKYSSGEVEVTAHIAPRRTIRFLVDDEGDGIPPADRERIFERFVRLDPAMERNRGGTGLGLYICRALAEGMEGRLWVETAPRGGARFVLELRASDIASENGRVHAPSERSPVGVS
jgi:signal transduction histidine kinase